MKLVKYAFGWNIYKLEGLKDYHLNEEYVVDYFIADKCGSNREPVEGKTIGEVLEKIADAEMDNEKYKNCTFDDPHDSVSGVGAVDYR